MTELHTNPTPELAGDELDELDGVEDFDAYWHHHKRKGARVRIMGEVVELPPAMPLQFELEARRLQRSKRPEDVRKLVAILFGPTALDRWTARGMDSDQFQLLLAWAPQRIALGDAAQTMAEVEAELAKADAEGDELDPTPAS